MDQWCGFAVWFTDLMNNLDMVAYFPLLVKVSIKERNKEVQSVNMGQAVSRVRTAQSKKTQIFKWNLKSYKASKKL